MKSNLLEQFRIQRELHIRKIIAISFITIFVIAIIIIFSMYISNKDFRNWIDINILRKNISTEDVPRIDLEANKNNQIFCFGRYIGILKEKNLQIYNSFGEKTDEISVNINTALYETNEKYLALAENKGQEICVILEKNYMWSKQLDGEILQIHINKNGYVAVLTTDTTYKSIITLFNSEGNQILRKYLSSSTVTDIDISVDNKYLAYAEIDTSGAFIQSNIEIISIEKTKENSEDAIYYTYSAEKSRMITKIMYQDKNKLACMYDDGIDIIENQTEKNIFKTDNKITFLSANLNNHYAYIQEETSGLFKANSVLNTVNLSNNYKAIYSLQEIAKEMYTYGNIIGLNIGTEIYFVNTSGMLIKKYTSNQEITNVIMTNQLAIVIYKDKAEIVNL